MAIDTYTEIAANVLEYLNRTAPSPISDKVEDFILLGQERIARKLRITEMMAITDILINDQVIAAPADLLEVKSFVLQGNVAREIRPAPINQLLSIVGVRTPQYYSAIGTNFYFGAAPQGDVTASLVYYAKPEFISPTVDTNIWTSICPDLVLYAALWEAAIYMKDDARKPEYEKRYMEIFDQLEYQDKNKYRNDGGPSVENVDMSMGFNKGRLP